MRIDVLNPFRFLMHILAYVFLFVVLAVSFQCIYFYQCDGGKYKKNTQMNKVRSLSHPEVRPINYDYHPHQKCANFPFY